MNVVDTRLLPVEFVDEVTVPIGSETSFTPEMVVPLAVTDAGFALKSR